MPASPKSASRVVALALACAANAGLFLLLWSSRKNEVPQQPVFAMIWISERPAPEPAPLPERKESRTAITNQMPPPIVVPPAPEQGTAITVPPIDWYAESARSARNAFPDDVREKPAASLDSKPQAMVLPDTSNRPPRAGDVWHFEGGETITWISELCYFKSDPPPDMTGGPPRLKLPTCKVRSLQERESEKRAAALAESVKPRYLRQPEPEPN